MTFGETVRKLRRKADYTQENLAELLGISPQAVSRWECDSAMPDVALLPRIAHLFGVSTDLLLGVDLDGRDRKIEEIRNRASRYAADGYLHDALRVLREGLREYPNAHALMAALADTLLLKGEYEESLSLAQWVIDHEADMKLRVDAISSAAFALDRMGRHERAEELVRTIPELGSDDLLIHLLKGSARVRELRHKALVDGMASLSCLFFLTSAEEDDGSPVLNAEERRAAYERLLDLYGLYFPDGDFGFYAQFPAQIHRELAKLCVLDGRQEDALRHLCECVRFGELFASCDPEAERDSLFFRGEADGGWVKSGPDYDYRREVAEWLKDPLFDAVRERIAQA